MTSTQGFQVKARDHDGKVHDERWSRDLATAKSALAGVREDPMVEAAWMEGDDGSLVYGPSGHA